MEINQYQNANVAKVTDLFAITYNRNDSGATEAPPASAARVLRNVFRNAEVTSGLTAGWAPYFCMDCICINEADPIEREKQMRLAPYIHSWTLDCTNPYAKIVLGNNAYSNAVVNFGGDLGNSIITMEEALIIQGRWRIMLWGG